MKMAKQTLAVLLALVMAFSAFSIVGSAKGNTTWTIDPLSEANGRVDYGLDIYKVTTDGEQKIEDGGRLAPGDVVNVVVSMGTDFYTSLISTLILFDGDYFEPAKNGSSYTEVPTNTFETGFNDNTGFIKRIIDPNVTGESINGTSYTLFDTVAPVDSGGYSGLVNKNTYNLLKGNFPLSWHIPNAQGKLNASCELEDEYKSLRFVSIALTMSDKAQPAAGELIKIPYAPYFSFQLKVKENVSTDDATTSIFIPIDAAKRDGKETCNKLYAYNSASGYAATSGIPMFGQGYNVEAADIDLYIGEPEGPHEHSYSVTEHKDATCTEDGYDVYTCSCGDTYTETIQRLGHNFEVLSRVEADCETDGKVTYKCSRCPETYEETLEHTGHNYQIDEANSKAATCTEAGYTLYVCQNNSTHTYQTPINPLGHEWSAWTEVTPATTTTEGLEKRECSRCHTTETQPIPKIPVTDADYTINVYTMDTTGTYQLTTTTTTGKIGTTVSVKATDYESEGLTVNTGKSTLSATLTEEGAELNVYIDRASATYTFKVYDYAANDGTYVEYDQVTAYYGADVLPPLDEPTVDGYTFKGWKTETGAAFTGGTAGLEDVEIFAEFEENIDPDAAAKEEEIADLNAAMATLVDAVNLKFYTDDAIMDVCNTLGGGYTDAASFIADAIANGYTYKGRMTSVEVNAATNRINNVLMAPSTTEGSLNYIEMNGDEDNAKYRDESKANLNVSVVPVSVESNGTTKAVTGDTAIAIQPGDVITFALKLETDYYVSSADLPVVFDATKFRLIDSNGDRYDYEEHDFDDNDEGLFNVEDSIPSLLADMSCLNSAVSSNYSMELFTVLSPEGQYPEAMRTADYMDQYKILLFELAPNVTLGRRMKAQIFTEDLSQLCTFQLQARDGFDYDGTVSSLVGIPDGWYATNEARGNQFAVTRATGYLANGTTVASHGTTNRYSFEPFDAYAQYGQTATTDLGTVVFGSTECEHEFGEPTWSWADDYSSATATFTCTKDCGYSEDVTDNAPVTVDVSAATCTDNATVKYTAKVNFGGQEYTTETDPIEVPDTATGHSFGEPVWTWANDYSYAKATFTCENDGCQYSEDVTDNAPATVDVSAATCTDNATIKYTAKVNFGGQEYTAETDPIEVPDTATGHSFGEPVWEWAADYSYAKATFTCGNDGCQYSEDVTDNAPATVDVSAATCTDNATVKYTAKVNFGGQEYTTETDPIEVPDTATGHSFGEPVWEWAADYSYAKATFTCGNDGCQYSEDVTDDEIDVTVVSDETCTDNRVVKYNASVQFNDTEYTAETDEIEILETATGHSFGEPTWVWAEDYSTATATFTCENDGCQYSEDVVCDDVDVETVSEASCVDNQVVTYTAVVEFNEESYTDKKENVEVLNTATGEHNLDDWEMIVDDETGDTDDVNHGKYCTVCGQLIETQAHNFTIDVVVTKEATEEEDGIKIVQCEDCGYQHEETIPALNHEHTFSGEPTWEWATDYSSATATFACTKDCGYSEEVTDDAPVKVDVAAATCEGNATIKYTAKVTFNEQEYTTETEVMEVENTATGHSFGEPEWEWETDYSKATATFTCTNDGCGHSEDVTDDAPVKVDVAAATCEGNATIKYTAKVTFNEQEYTTETEVMEVENTATGHSFGEPVWEWAADYSYAKATFTCGNDGCQYSEDVTDNEPATVDVDAATCTDNATIKYTAKVTFNEQEYTTETDPIEVPDTATGHIFGEWQKDENGHSRFCTNEGCDVADPQNGPHIYGAWSTVTPATTEEDGLKKHTCDICGYEETAPIPKIVVADGAIKWAGYEDAIETITLDEGTLPEAQDYTVYVIAKKGTDGMPSKIQLRHSAGNTYTYTRSHDAVESITDVTFGGEACELWVINRGAALKDGTYVAVGRFSATTSLVNVPDSDGVEFTVENEAKEIDNAVYSAKIETIDPDLGYIVFDGVTKQVVTIETGLDVEKVQLKNDDTNGTMTFTKDNQYVTVADGTLTDGTPCLVWTITRIFAKGEYNMSVWQRSESGLADSGVDLQFTVDSIPVEALVSAKAAPNDDDATVVFTVVTADTASKVRLTNTADNTTSTYTPDDDSVVYEKNSDGTATWTITMQKSFGKSYTIDVTAKLGYDWSDAITLNFSIAEKPTTEKLISAAAVANDDGTVTITVVTTKDAAKVKLIKTSDSSTITIKRGNALATTTDNDEEGTTTWVITLTKTAGQTYEYNVQTSVGGVYYGDKTISFTMPE